MLVVLWGFTFTAIKSIVLLVNVSNSGPLPHDVAPIPPFQVPLGGDGGWRLSNHALTGSVRPHTRRDEDGSGQGGGGGEIGGR